MRNIEYTVNIDGISPSNEQFCGTQGEHKATKLKFNLAESLRDDISSNSVNKFVKYRFDVYDGEGGIWQGEPQELSLNEISIELEEKHTRHGGKITVYLVITVLSEENETERELYSFPAKLWLKNRPEGIYQEGESYESVSALAEAVKENSNNAAISATSAQMAYYNVKAFAEQIEEKLENGEFNGVSATHSWNGTVLSVTSASGTSSADLKGEKGDMPDLENYYTKDEVDNLAMELTEIDVGLFPYNHVAEYIGIHDTILYSITSIDEASCWALAFTDNTILMIPYSKIATLEDFADFGIMVGKRYEYEVENIGGFNKVTSFKKKTKIRDYVDTLAGVQFISYGDDALWLENGGDTSIKLGNEMLLAAPYGINVDGTNIKNVGAPINNTDAATKGYVDDAVANAATGGVDLSNYYTKEEVDNLASIKYVIQDNEIDVSLNSPSGDAYILVSDRDDIDIRTDYNINVNQAKIVNLATPENDTDAVNKAYVDDLVGDIESLLGGI